jgi:hypothetical protein
MNQAEPLAVSQQQIDELLTLAKGCFPQDQYCLLEAVLGTFARMMQHLHTARASVARLKRMIFGARTERKRQVLKQAEDAAAGEQSAATSPVPGDAAPEAGKDAGAPPAPDKKKRKGHGRNGVQAYPGAAVICVAHASLKSGDPCPQCVNGKLYPYEPKQLLRWIGQAPLVPTRFELACVRCRLCDSVFCAALPEGVSQARYSETAASMIALLKYGSGMPFYRLQGLQTNLQLPLPDATQWEIVARAAVAPREVFAELMRQAAQAPLLYNDDTPARILQFDGEAARKRIAQDPAASSRAVFTSGIVAALGSHHVVLYMTGQNHAGENLAKVLEHRARELDAPMQMCDALSRNYPKGFQTVISNCLIHARRNFVDVVEPFPEPCRFVIQTLAEVYRHEGHGKEHNLTHAQRLAYHQQHSAPLMEELRKWMHEQFEQRKVEPNSGLGKAIRYMDKHWSKLTLFLRQAGAPLDNNICERALKKAILHRKNSMYYRTQLGAQIGDIYMSLIGTCQMCKVNPFDYLNALQRYAQRVHEQVHRWLPWNYHEQLADSG